MILPRWMAWLRAKMAGDWWLPCPVCGGGFSGFECAPDGVNYRANDGGWECDLVCPKSSCVAEAKRQAKHWYSGETFRLPEF